MSENQLTATMQSICPILSVVIPAYNAEATITRCVRSVLSNRDVALEVIIVNDGSRDDTGTICDALAQADPRVRVVHKQNGGPGAARNTGMENAAGKYLAFVDADDTVAADMYRRMLSVMEQENADCVVCNIENRYVDHTERLAHVFGNCVIRGNQNIRERVVVPLIDPERRDDAMLQSGCNKLYRAALIREKGVSFSALRWAEDWLFNIEYLMHTQCVAFITQWLYYYDLSTVGSLSKTWDPSGFSNALILQERREALFPEYYPVEQRPLKVLWHERRQLRLYVDGNGLRGFRKFGAAIFHNEKLRNAYRKLDAIPATHRFAKWCVEHDWAWGYYLWSVGITLPTLTKRMFRPLYRGLRQLLRR